MHFSSSKAHSLGLASTQSSVPTARKTPTPNLPPDKEILELNLTHETWSFPKQDLGSIPDRGFGEQKDINLFGKV
jgi:hypothetical protein